MFGKQVAVLVLTTILAQQHYRTFCQRMAEYPVTIQVISRFRTPQEQKQILEKTAAGGVDILIGTHRIIQNDVQFRDLGLLIVDEEQRFGVEQKEFLKWARQTVDVLTMTATPIPRTLHMSLMGIQDISALNTPPQDRQSIRTEVCRFDSRLIRDAILREMNRGGQVFFLHNRVYNITQVAARVAEIVPEARIVIGHGQMREGELEENMTDFIDHKYDILVCTTIIGSGVDIPNVNTIFIHDADRFGLAEAHQFRGRVGRYKHRAYAYFLIPEDRPITPKALRRLKAIEEFSELGAGFKIAMRDLEIRGAGNILGPEQSGHIGAVGYDLYCKLLDVTVRQLKSEAFFVPMDVRVELGFPAFLPDDYVPSERQKMEIYRRLSRCYDPDALAELENGLLDRFGKLPDPVRMLLDQARMRVLAQPWKIGYIRRLEDRVEFRTLSAKAVAHDLQVARNLVRQVDARTVHVLLPDSVSEPPGVCAFVLEMLGTKASEIPTGIAVIPTSLMDGLRPIRPRPSAAT
jgi:transcription-repair coupling factor (superfamily II helicase)